LQLPDPFNKTASVQQKGLASDSQANPGVGSQIVCRQTPMRLKHQQSVTMTFKTPLAECQGLIFSRLPEKIPAGPAPRPAGAHQTLNRKSVNVRCKERAGSEGPVPPAKGVQKKYLALPRHLSDKVRFRRG